MEEEEEGYSLPSNVDEIVAQVAAAEEEEENRRRGGDNNDVNSGSVFVKNLIFGGATVAAEGLKPVFAKHKKLVGTSLVRL